MAYKAFQSLVETGGGISANSVLNPSFAECSSHLPIKFVADISMTFLHSVDTVSSFSQQQIFGIGRTGLVIRREQFDVKIPLRWSTSSNEEVEANIESLQHEQSIYRRLGECGGVVPALSSSETATTLLLMENGDLRSYLSQNKPSKCLKISWFREMARTLGRIHEKRVIVADIASRNFLLDSGLSVQFCDFTESIKMPLDTCMETADFGAYSIQTDIGKLGAVMYEVVVGEKCEFDIFKDIPPELSRGRWPRREDLPSTKGVWLGPIIDKCWTKGALSNAIDLCNELESARIKNESAGALSPSRSLLSVVRCVIASGQRLSYCYTTCAGNNA